MKRLDSISCHVCDDVDFTGNERIVYSEFHGRNIVLCDSECMDEALINGDLCANDLGHTVQ